MNRHTLVSIKAGECLEIDILEQTSTLKDMVYKLLAKDMANAAWHLTQARVITLYWKTGSYTIKPGLYLYCGTVFKNSPKGCTE